MARILKKTRIKGIPAKVQLQARDATTGSFPAQVRQASDNRSGNYRTYYDDNKTVDFKSFAFIPEVAATTPGFNALADYTNYSLGPGVVGTSPGDVILWWRFEEVVDDGYGKQGIIDDSFSHHSASFHLNNFSPLSTDVPSYYNNAATDGYANNYSLYLTGSGDTLATVGDVYSDRKSDTNFFGNKPFTLSAHVKFVSPLLTYNAILWRGVFASSFSDFELFVTSAGKVRFGVVTRTSGIGKFYETNLALISADTWYHIAVTFDGNNVCKIYVNGTERANSVIIDGGWADFTTGNNPIYLGLLRDSDHIGAPIVAHAYFDQVLVANRVATADEISFLYLGAPIPGGLDASSISGVAMPSGLFSTNSALTRVNQSGTVVTNEEMTTDIITTGTVRKGIGDSFVTFTPGQDFQPFRDDWNPAVDGLSTIVGNTQDVFYATGSKISDVGEGFDQPLWAKSKIEIDLTPSVTSSFKIRNYTSGSNSFPMAYWNKTLKLWQGIGAGKEFGNYLAGAQIDVYHMLEDQTIGFAEGMNNGGVGSREYNAGSKISNFGFPAHVKYHGTSSQTVAMSDYISEPFLLEKVVLFFSGSLIQNSTDFAAVTKFTTTTFFILNQRSPFKVDDPGMQGFVWRNGASRTDVLVTGANIPGSYNNGSSVNTVRDLVTYAQITAFSAGANASTKARASRELVIESTSPLTTGNCTWSGKLVLSGVVKSPLPNTGTADFRYGADTLERSLMLINKHSTRSGLLTPGGRDHVGALESGQVVSKTDILAGGGGTDPTGVLTVLSKNSKVNPYLLMPGDQLIFGWQLPIPNTVNGATPQYPGNGTEMSIGVAPSKIVFYGSQIQGGVEHHDTLNQLLTSVAVHEDIGK